MCSGDRLQQPMLQRSTDSTVYHTADFDFLSVSEYLSMIVCLQRQRHRRQRYRLQHWLKQPLKKRNQSSTAAGESDFRCRRSSSASMHLCVCCKIASVRRPSGPQHAPDGKILPDKAPKDGGRERMGPRRQGKDGHFTKLVPMGAQMGNKMAPQTAPTLFQKCFQN